MSKKPSELSSLPGQIVLLDTAAIEGLQRHPKHAALSSRDPNRVARVRDAVLRVGKILKPAILNLKGEVLGGWTRVCVALALKLSLPVICLDLPEDVQVEFIAEDNAFDQAGASTRSDHFRATVTLWESCSRNAEKESGGHVATGEGEAKTRDRVAAKYGRISPRQVQRYRTTFVELNAADPTAWERIKDRDDCYEEAVRIIKAHKANMENEAEPAAAASGRLDARVERTFMLIEKALAAAKELQALSPNLRLEELRRIKTLFEGFAALVAAIEQKRTEAYRDPQAPANQPVLEQK